MNRIEAVMACTNCKHPRIQHTGRSIWPGDKGRLPGSTLGPIYARWDDGCEALEDFHHTCACSQFLVSAADASERAS